MTLGPVLRYPGSKWRLARWIVSHFPPHTVYLEPFFGSGAVFFTKPPSKVETINDLDGRVVNLFRVIRERPEALAALVEMTPWAREEYYVSYDLTGDPLEDARRFLVRCWQAQAARIASRTGWRHDVQGSPGVPAALLWAQLPKRILAVADRLKYAQIEQQPALELVPRYAYPQVLIYADPPYPMSTRTGRLYACEMSDEEHSALLDVLDAHPGPVVLSGYACELYDSRLRHWTRTTRRALAEKGNIAEEVLWLNPVCANALGGTLFSEEVRRR